MYIAIYTLPLVYVLYACENIDNCEWTLIFIIALAYFLKFKCLKVNRALC